MAMNWESVGTITIVKLNCHFAYDQETGLPAILIFQKLKVMKIKLWVAEISSQCMA
jgi:hypothetical protein